MTHPGPAGGIPPFLAEIVVHLRRRQIQVGIDDLRDLRNALRADFGLRSSADLRELCVALWAGSLPEAEVIRAVFASLAGIPEWRAGTPASPGSVLPDVPHEPAAGKAGDVVSQDEGKAPYSHGAHAESVRTENSGPGPLRTGTRERGLQLVPQYPLAAREVAQAWRHLRRPVRSGPPAELDVAASIRERALRGVATPPVVVPRRRNAVRLMLLIDRNGSMAPFHGYIDFVVAAIRDAARIDDVLPTYFHDVPGSANDRSVLDADPFRADLDPVLDRIAPLRGGRVYLDPGLTQGIALANVLAQVTPATAVLVISDGGAARGNLDVGRLLDAVALLKAVGPAASGTGWLNPVAAQRWAGTTAEAIARHVPMYPFTRQGLYAVIDALRGRPAPVARPL